MTPSASSTRALSDGSQPAAQSRYRRTTQLFKGCVPEFAHAQWLAIQRPGIASGTSSPQPRRSPQVHTYVVREDGRPVVLVFFQLDKKTALVLNDTPQESGAELQDFCRHLFQHFPAVRRICFLSQQRFIHTKEKKCSRHPSNRLLLPRHPSVRMEQSLRFNHRNIRYFLRRLKQDHPDFAIECHAHDAVTASHCRALLQLHRPQAVDKRQAESPLDEAGENLVRAVQEAGLVCLLKIGGRIVAGAICLRSGGDWQLHVLACDPRFQAYGLGMLCCYFTVCEHKDRQRHKSGATINRPRPTHVLMVRQERTTVLTVKRPQASLLVRCDHAIYSACMDCLQQAVQLRNNGRQLWQAAIRLLAAGGSALQLMRKRLASVWRLSSLPAFLRSH